MQPVYHPGRQPRRSQQPVEKPGRPPLLAPSTNDARKPYPGAVARPPSKKTQPPSDPSQWTRLRLFLCRFFLKLGARAHDAEDLAQESLARVIGAGRERGEPVPLGYAAAVGRNLWRDQLRARARRPTTEPVPSDDALRDAGDAPPEAAAGREDEARLAAAIESLDPRHRDAIKLVIIGRMSYADAAHALGIPRGTVKSRIHYGLGRLRAILCEREPGRRSPPC
jgi:RNA polymerase sigma-70 factor, ECF subfamily